MVQFETDDAHERMCEDRSKLACNRRKKERVNWQEVSDRMGDYQFRRMFRMSRRCFQDLCFTIIGKVGESAFKSQAYIDAFLKQTKMYVANEKTTAGYICGEIKLAITIRLLAGGDALDLAVIFDIYPTHLAAIMREVLTYWIIKPNIGKIDIIKYLENKEAMDRVSNGFAKRSNGVLTGAIGAIDGWLVKIRRPNNHMDGVTNPVPFYSRKGYYGLNVQCIVDDRKKVLWAKFNNKGASHDSTCFKNSDLYQHLISIGDELFNERRFFLGDSAYGIQSFIIPPYDSPLSKTPEDDYIFFHSSARITVECAFGEIDLRWGIFWKRLCGSVDTNIMICEGAMHLHNYLVDFRDEHDVDYNYENMIFLNDCRDNGHTSEVTTNDSIRLAGRPSHMEESSRLKGLQIRDKLRQEIYNHDMHRPRKES